MNGNKSLTCDLHHWLRTNGVLATSDVIENESRIWLGHLSVTFTIKKGRYNIDIVDITAFILIP